METKENDTEDENSEVEKEKWKNFHFHIPEYDDRGKPWYLEEEELKIIKKNVKGGKSVQVRLVVAKGDYAEKDARVEKMREQIHADYDGKVLCKEVIPNPPERGRFGYAHIPLKPDAIPQREKPFRQFGEKHEALKKITEEWIERGFIEKPTEKNCEWLTQAFVVPKKSPTFPWRGVVDMRGPNSQMRRSNYPLPSIENILVKHGKNLIFSVLDLRQAFHQQPLHPDSRHITCTYTPLGVYQWKVNVMGLKNASVQFQRMMDEVLEPVRDIADCYVDDIIIGTRVEEGEDLLMAHDRDLRRVLNLLQEQHLVADISKCKLFVPEVEFCGNVLGGGIRKPGQGKLSAIQFWEQPKNITELGAFLGMANYYHIFIKDYSELVAKLQDKLKVPREFGKKGSKFPISWDEEDQKVFEELKKRLCSKLELQRVNPDKPFVVRVDASNYAVGATLEQMIDENRIPTIDDVRAKKTVPVAFFSRKLTEGQRKWHPREQETYAIVLALLKWQSWIGLQPVLVLTDHKSLEQWAKEEIETPSGPAGRRLRWHLVLSKFDLEVGYIPGKENEIQDILSRWAYPASTAYRDVTKHGSEKDDREMKKIIEEELKVEQKCAHNYGEDPEKQEDIPTIMITPVGGEADSSASSTPQFTFAKPRIIGPKPGKQLRPDPTSVRKSPPNREVGPTEESSNGEEEETESEIMSDDEGEMQGDENGPNEINGDEDEENEEENEEEETEEEEEEHEAPLGTIHEPNWSEWYPKDKMFKEIWEIIQNDETEWPVGIQVIDGRMFENGKLCIPTPIQSEWIREMHQNIGHVGNERLWQVIENKFQWGNKTQAKRLTMQMTKQCDTCQACQRPRNKYGPIVYAPVTPHLMANMAIDVFQMPTVQMEGKTYDCMVLCIDRHSGWMVVIPELISGMTGAKVARAMLKTQWRPFGIPTKITSDQGPHFVNSWWKAMCATLGINHVYTQPYHHQANGKVERTGQQVMEILRKLHTDNRMNWVEKIPYVVDKIHDMPGETGLSPYEIVFGRERFNANVPYKTPTQCEDAQDFFQRMEKIDKEVAEKLNEIHRKQAERKNRSRKDSEPFPIGRVVWYRRPENTGTKLDTRWVGPCVIMAREGEFSYIIKTNDNSKIKAHRTFLKEYWEDTYNENPKPMFFHQRTVQTTRPKGKPLRVKKILSHTIESDGSYKFLTQREGEDSSLATYMTPNEFLAPATEALLEYCQKNKLRGGLEILAKQP